MLVNYRGYIFSIFLYTVSKFFSIFYILVYVQYIIVSEYILDSCILSVYFGTLPVYSCTLIVYSCILLVNFCILSANYFIFLVYSCILSVYMYMY